MRFEVFKAFIDTDAWLPRATQLLVPQNGVYTHPSWVHGSFPCVSIRIVFQSKDFGLTTNNTA